MQLRGLLSCMIASCLLVATPALAEDALQFQYSKSTVTLVRSKPPVIPPSLPWLAATVESPALAFDVEVRDGATLYNQKGWYNLSSPEDNGGVLLAFGEPSMAPVIHSTQYAPLDVLMIDSEGKIIQIIPSLKLSELTKEIVPQHPVQAFMFLKGGIAQRMSINPGDMVEYALFKKSPVVIGTNERRKEKLSLPDLPEALEDQDMQSLTPSAGRAKKEPSDSPIK